MKKSASLLGNKNKFLIFGVVSAVVFLQKLLENLVALF